MTRERSSWGQEGYYREMFEPGANTRPGLAWFSQETTGAIACQTRIKINEGLCTVRPLSFSRETAVQRAGAQPLPSHRSWDMGLPLGQGLFSSSKLASSAITTVAKWAIHCHREPPARANRERHCSLKACKSCTCLLPVGKEV